MAIVFFLVLVMGLIVVFAMVHPIIFCVVFYLLRQAWRSLGRRTNSGR